MPEPEPVLPPAERKTSRKGIMAREVVRVVTPGTILEGELLDGQGSELSGCNRVESG